MVPLRARTLTPDEDKALARITRSRKLCAGRVRRAQIVLLSTRGLLAEEIAEELHIHERPARRWIGRFNQRGLDGLDEGKGIGTSPLCSLVARAYQVAYLLVSRALELDATQPFGPIARP